MKKISVAVTTLLLVLGLGIWSAAPIVAAEHGGSEHGGSAVKEDGGSEHGGAKMEGSHGHEGSHADVLLEAASELQISNPDLAAQLTAIAKTL